GSAAPTQLASGQPWPRGINVDATNLYWVNETNNGDVMKLPLAGGPALSLGVGTNPRGLAVDATYAYFCNGNGQGDVLRAPIAGGGPTDVIAPSQSAPWGMAVDATYVYFSDNTANGAIRRVPKAGGTPELLSTGKLPYSIAIDATS